MLGGPAEEYPDYVETSEVLMEILSSITWGRMGYEHERDERSCMGKSLD
jgi:hypothetical protein